MDRGEGAKQSCWIISFFFQEMGGIIPEMYELGRAGMRNLRRNEKCNS